MDARDHTTLTCQQPLKSVINYALKQYPPDIRCWHVQKQPLYKKAYGSANILHAIAHVNRVYKTSKKVYPYIAPVANPALEKIQPYVSRTVNYWKPISVAA